MLWRQTRSFLPWRFLFVLGILLAGLSLIGVGVQGTIRAEQPRAITLLYFEATGRDGEVLIDWATATEFETAGFWLKRATAELGPYSVLNNIGFVPATGGGIGGAEYSVVDDTVTNGITYWYKLVEVELNGNENVTEPIWVIPGPPTPTATATATLRPGETPSPTATPTSTATSTQTTTGGGSSATLTPTRTPTSTGGPSQATATARPGTTPQPTSQGQSGGGTSGSNGTPQTIGQVPTATNAAGYPVPPSQTEAPPPAGVNNQNGYPSLSTATPLSYPSDGSPPPTQPGNTLDGTSTTAGPQSQPPVASTIQMELQQTPSPFDQQQGSQQQKSSSALLWIAFVAALLVFGAGAVGSIIIFTRQGRRDDSQ